MALFSPPNLQNLSAFSAKPISLLKPQLLLLSKKPNFSLVLPRATENGGGMVGSAAPEEKLDKKEEASTPDLGKKEEALGMNGTAAAALKFENPRWVGGTWDLKQFSKDGKTNWDAVIDAEARRRKWLEDNPESSSNEDPILFDTSIIPWWAWMKRFHLPEAELLNGRAAMIGFFTAYLVDSLTGVGLVDQMGNFFCKTLLFVAVVGVLLIRKNEDIDSLKKLFEETTLYDKQWQAAWKDESTSSLKKD
ncbi:hypothetical protein AAC387_Pa08g2043 [Persea americana]|eukprot:TRINITY_DN108_c0_g1_i1.p1 TRINITY_DN108_c0_g1~~TRINITY_DN108_c0_g1_i1.p1  ORF type:complete len:280 (+),score=70.85 TRINITY_DN108_c0_g1_i1:94-840(+)